MFKSAARSAYDEIEDRKHACDRLAKFGIDSLDDSMGGIMDEDLVLLGAPSGGGKTQLCCGIARANILAGKSVHYIALEAGKFEIERRLKYPMVYAALMADEDRKFRKWLTYRDWRMGKLIDELAKYEIEVSERFAETYKNLFLYYKQGKFDVKRLIESVISCADRTDLIIIDHVHYFDWEQDNDNKAIKEIAMTVRDLSLEQRRAIILVGHLRKRDRWNSDLVAGLDEFHGSSELYKIATRVVTMARGNQVEDGCFETFFRVPKDRIEGANTSFISREVFDPRINWYTPNIYRLAKLGVKNSEDFDGLEFERYPEWAGSRQKKTSNAIVSTQRRADIFG